MKMRTEMKKMISAFCIFAMMSLFLLASNLSAETVTTVCPKATDEVWFGAPIPASGYDPHVPDCGMTAARIFDAPIAGLEKILQPIIQANKTGYGRIVE